MSSPSQVAAGFTITGLLDGASRTRGRYPVSEIAVADNADHPYERMPCRVIEGIDDERAVTLLHAANYFTRALTVTERAAATAALRGPVTFRHARRRREGRHH